MMDQRAVAVRRYLSPPTTNWFWRWDEGGRVLVWQDGQTIAFREELIAVLQPHVYRGLPPLDCIVLMLAATRDNWASTKSLVASWGLTAAASPEPDILELLDRVNSLPDARRKPTESKVELSSLVFEKFAKRLSAQDSAAVLEALTKGPTAELIEARWTSAQIDQVSRTVSAGFRKGLSKVDAESLSLRSRTGLDQLPEPVTEDLMPSTRARNLISSLQDDHELGGLARVARQLMATVHLPQKVSEIQELPLGGVSDLTNRGDLDRLLVSELAHDDLTLAVRLALNEALFLRRESPPKSPPTQQSLLIDSGIRMWGVPRVFAAAVGLALTAVSGKQTHVSSFRPSGGDIVPIDLSTHQGLIEHLEALEPDPHPGAALEAFLQTSLADQEPVDCVVVTGEDVLADGDFQRELAQLPATTLFIATVSRHGRFRLELRGPRRRHQVREAQLDLEKLFTPPPRPVSSLVDKALSSVFPAIMFVKPFPLRLLINEAPLARRGWTVGNDRQIALTRDGRLLYWDRRDQGGIQIAEHISHRRQRVWSTSWDDPRRSQVVFAASRPNRLLLVTIDLEQPGYEPVELELDGRSLSHVDHVSWHGGAVFVFLSTPQVVLVYDRSGGRKLQEIRLPDGCYSPVPQVTAGRFVRRSQSGVLPDEWYALAFDGSQARWEKVTHVPGAALPRLIALFDWHGHDGPMGISANGDLLNTTTGEWTHLQTPLWDGIEISNISGSGDRLIVKSPRKAFPASSPEAHFNYRSPVIETGTGRVTTVAPWEAIEGLDFYQPWPRPRYDPNILRTSFKIILVDENKDLALVSRGGHLWRMTCKDGTDRLHLYHRQTGDAGNPNRCDCAQWQSHTSLRTSDRVSEHPQKSYKLRVATWPDGSRAFFDSRGLLHLASSNRDIPVTTIVLYQADLAGWSADGRMWGSDFFTGGRSNASGRTIYQDILQPFARTVRC